jgi:hypothetical protein
MIKLNHIYLFDGQPHRCTMLNDCRARLTPVNKVKIAVTPSTGANAGKVVSFEKTPDGANISPNSELPEVR